MMEIAWTGRALVLAQLAATLAAQPGEHERRVHVGNGVYVSQDQAPAKGYFFYRDRWLPVKLKPKLARWEQLDEKVRSWSDAYRDKSKHYRIMTNAPHYVTELEIKPFLDELYRTYVTVFKEDFGLKGRAADKNHIHILWGYEAWKANEHADRGNPGYYTPGEALTVMYDPTDVDDFYNTVFHEGAHQFFNAMLPGADLPVWLSEALAVYFEGCTFSRSTLKITKNHLPANRLDSARISIREAKQAGRELTPLALFMSITDADRFDAEHYALAWSYLHFLIHRDGGKHKREVYAFLKEMNGSGAKPVHRVFREATRQDLAEIDKGWIDHVLALEQPPLPARQVLSVAQPVDGVDIRSGDLLDRIDGRRIHSGADFAKYWANRDASKATRLLLLRRYDEKGPMDYRQRWVTIDVPPDCKIAVGSSGAEPFERNVVE